MTELSDQDPITVSIEPLGNLSELGRDWCELEQRASCSFFQSWFWIKTWLHHMQDAAQMVRVVQGGRVVALGVLAASLVPRPMGGILPIIGLNEAPATDLSKISIEYNGLLCEAGLEDVAHQHFIKFLIQNPWHWHDWKECRLPGCSINLTDTVRRHAPFQRLYRHEVAPYVDLEDGFADLDSYLKILSKNARHQLRRSLRRYEEAGSLSLIRPGTLDSATQTMDRLISLHETQWQARGQPGAFSNLAFRDFHFDLLKTHFNTGVIDLVEVKAGNQVVGILYNFIYARSVSSYQSGFVYEADNRMKPGLVCHALAISDYASKGLQTYRFLAGDQRYKKSLSTGIDELYWIAIQRPDVRMRVENGIRAIKAKVRGGRGR